jgi:hypothetical protein
VAVSAEVEGLAPNSTYHFRIVASNAGGTGSGADQMLRTLPNPPSVETSAASTLGPTRVTLNASVNPNGGAVSDCHFEYGISVFYEASIPCAALPGSGTAAVAVSAAVEGLAPITTIHFRIVASNAGGTGSGADQEFATLPNAPAITLVNPNAGPLAGGSTVAITGTNLGEATNVRFGSVPASSFTVASDTSITAVSPAGTGTVDVTLTTPSGTSSTSSSDRFTYTPAPAVSGVSPVKGPVGGGTATTITGTDFTGATAVRFGSINAATFTVKSATSISATTPAESAGVTDVTVVTAAGGTSLTVSSDHFTFDPTITNVSPNGGPMAGGTRVTVSGTGFAVGATMIEFGGKKATSVSCSSSTTCIAVSPAHEVGTVHVKATAKKVASLVSTADQFTYS